jgi:hypothetical protein
MTKTCPHCHCEFECRNDNVLECDCIHVTLSREALDYIGSRYPDCLCADCLREINRMLSSTRQYDQARQYDMEKALIKSNH